MHILSDEYNAVGVALVYTLLAATSANVPASNHRYQTPSPVRCCHLVGQFELPAAESRPCCPVLSHFQYTPFSCRLLLAKCKHDHEWSKIIKYGKTSGTSTSEDVVVAGYCNFCVLLLCS